MAEAGGLLGAQGLARLDQVHLDGIAKGRHGLRGAQRIGQQRAPAGAELDEAHGPGPAHGLPDRRAPEADQLAEHLAHLRRGDEVARSADGPAAAVIAVRGVRQAELHVGGDAERPVPPDSLPDLRRQGGHDSARPPSRGTGGMRRMRKRPSTIIGIDSTCPMVRPGRMNPRKASGSRNSSAMMRATP